jgi:hypothetical protein
MCDTAAGHSQRDQGHGSGYVCVNPDSERRRETALWSSEGWCAEVGGWSEGRGVCCGWVGVVSGVVFGRRATL